MEEGFEGTKEKKMTMTEWARNEIKRAIKKNKDDDYGNACRKSALKAFESLAEDNHSGFSFEVTKQILERLMEGLPLAPINNKGNFDKQGQCKRMPSLFMHGAKGHETFTDHQRTMCVDESGLCFTSNIASNVTDTIWPIKLPYWPTIKKYEFKFKKDRIESAITPNGEFLDAPTLARMYAKSKWLKGAKTTPDLTMVKTELEDMFFTSVEIARKVDLHANSNESVTTIISFGGLPWSRLALLERNGELVDWDDEKGDKTKNGNKEK